MPYRRLPNTDKARLKALKTALEKGKEIPPFKLAFSQRTNSKLQGLVSRFENAVSFYRQCYENQVDRNREYSLKLKKARLYISHFIQVINMAITRGDLQSDIKRFYSLPRNETKTPTLTSEADIIKWGEKLIKGEAQRAFEGFPPVTNPTVALVRVRYENFLEAYHNQKTLQKNTERAHDKLVEIRGEADSVILDIWNEVEKHFEDLPGNAARKEASGYGVVYVYRKNEISSLNAFGQESDKKID